MRQVLIETMREFWRMTAGSLTQEPRRSSTDGLSCIQS